jgi:O-methyltransferase
MGRITNKLKRVRESIANRNWYALHEKYREFTMMNPTDYVRNLKLVSQYASISGCVVECGVWRGGVIGAMAELLGKNRTYHLFDSFEGLPPAKEIDGQGALDYQKNTDSPNYFDNCIAEKCWAKKAMNLSGADKYHLVQGWFDKTVPGYTINEPIAILRLDGDWYDSTMVCLEHWFPKVAQGGLIIIDDYYMWDGCARAVHEYLSKNNCIERIHDAYSTGCYLVKA